MTLIRMATIAACILSSTFLSQQATAAVIEVTSGSTGARGVNISAFGPVGQSFTAIDTTLTSFAFQFQTFNDVASSPVMFSLLVGEGLTGTALTTMSLSLPANLPARTGSFYSFDIAPTSVTIGQKYTAVLTSSTNRYGVALGPEYNIQTGVPLGGDAYGGGKALFTTIPFSNCDGATNNCDFNFRLTGTSAVPAVPEPASWALMIGGLAMVGGSLRRRPRRAGLLFSFSA